jgi:uncharacterized phage-associated protein
MIKDCYLLKYDDLYSNFTDVSKDSVASKFKAGCPNRRYTSSRSSSVTVQKILVSVVTDLRNPNVTQLQSVTHEAKEMRSLY